MGLGGFVVYDDVDAFDVEAARGEVGCEEEVDFAVAEGLDGLYALVGGRLLAFVML